MRADFLEFKHYYQDVKQKFLADSFYLDFINHKFVHSVDVLHVGQTILSTTPELKNKTAEFKDYAQKALLFHDVGRFQEAFLRFQADNEQKGVAACSNLYDHGSIGYELLKNNPLYNDLRILFAVKYHGKMMEEVRSSLMMKEVELSPYEDDIIKILYLVRDADKLANLWVIKAENHLEKDIFYKQLTKEALKAPLSEEVKEQFFSQKTILFPTVHTFADRILYVLSWVFDFNYQVTKEIFAEKEYALFLFSLLVQYHKNQEDLDKIKKIIHI